MTTYQSNRILDEVENLIAYTCRNQVSHPERADSFHRALIKKYFNASEVAIDHKNHELFMTLTMPEGKDDIPVHLKLEDLESFLKACIEDDLRSLAFYQNMLGYYTIIAAAS